MKDENSVVFPINITSPIEIYLNQNTGELVLECVPLGFADNRRFRLILEPKAALEMMSAIPAIESNFRTLIEEKAKLNFVQ